MLINFCNSNKLPYCYSNAFKKHRNNTGTVCLKIILWTSDMFFHTGLTELKICSSWLKSTASIIFRLVFFLIMRQSWLWRCDLKKLRYKLTATLKVWCYRCFSKNLAKFYRATISMNLFRCVQSKSQWSTHSVVFFNLYKRD